MKIENYWKDSREDRKQRKGLCSGLSSYLLDHPERWSRIFASELHTRPNTVLQWRDRYLRNDIKGLYDETRTGKPKKYPPDLKTRIVKLIETDPPLGHAVWNGPLIAEKLGVSDDTVWKILRDEGIQL